MKEKSSQDLDDMMQTYLENELTRPAREKQNESLCGHASSESDDPSADVSVRLKQDLLRIVAAGLKMPAEKMDIEKNMAEYGADSLLVTELMKQISDHLGFFIMPTIFFEAKHLDELSDILLKRFNDKIMSLYANRAQEEQADIGSDVVGQMDIDEEVAHWIQKRRAVLSSPSDAALLYTDDSAYEPIAIIAMEGAFPESANLREFDRHLCAGDDCIREIPQERWDWKSVYGDPEKGEFTNVKYGGFIPDIDCFDPLFFGVSPKEAKLMDPQHRMFMQCVWKLIESAGYAPRSMPCRNMGIFLGINLRDYAELIDQAAEIDALLLTGLSHMFCPNRLSFFLDQHGPSQVIDTACSSSLVALHRAALSLQHEDCDMAIAGGVNLLLTPTMHIVFSKAGMICTDGRCKTFSEDANGYVRSDGVGAVLLKKLKQAERDGDPILGIVRGSAENHGGLATALTAPNPKAQAELMVDTLRKAKVDPRSISYMECHGTGTSLGDPIEINGLKMAFEEVNRNGKTASTPMHYCGLGSVKSNMGHAETAAGIAGLIKVLLGMKNRYLYQTLHCENINPLIELEQSPFYILQEGKTWEPPIVDGKTAPRIAGISSFGAGGSNAYAIIEEYLDKGSRFGGGDSVMEKNDSLFVNAVSGTKKQKSVLVVLSAKNEDRLREGADNLQTYLTANDESKTTNLREVAYTLQVGREAMEERLALIVTSAEELIEKLNGFLDGRDGIENIYRGRVKRKKEAVAVSVVENEIETAIEEWVAHKRCSAIADIWVKGLNFDWNTLYGEIKPRRVSLPTYPFERERYWVEKTGSVSRCKQHSLTHENISTNKATERISLPHLASSLASFHPSSHVEKRSLTPLNVNERSFEVEKNETVSLSPSCVQLYDHGKGVFSVQVRDLSNRNLLSEQVMFGLVQRFCEIQDREEAKALLLIGEDQVFLSGGAKEREALFGQRITRLSLDCDFPVIAVMKGSCTGMGWLLGSLCDFMICEEEGLYQYHCNGSDWFPSEEERAFFVERFSEEAADFFLSSEKPYKGRELNEIGINPAVIPQGQVDSYALKMAYELAEVPRESLIQLKRHLSKGIARQIEKLAYPLTPLVEEKRRPNSREKKGFGFKEDGGAVADPGIAKQIKLTSDVVKVEAYSHGIVLAALCDQTEKNIFSEALVKGIMEFFEHVKRTPEYKVVILTGYDNYFACGGTKEGVLAIHEGRATCADAPLYELPLLCEIPVIAAMQGHGIGAGWSMGMFCDDILFSEESVYSSRFMQFGFTPGFGSTLIFPHRLGKDLGYEILFKSREYKGHELKSRGMKHPVLPRSKVRSHAIEMANRMALSSREELVRLKNNSCRNLRERLPEIIRREVAMHGKTFVGNPEVLAKIQRHFNEGIRERKNPELTEPEHHEIKSLETDKTMFKKVYQALRETLADELHMKPEQIENDLPFIDMRLDSITGVTWVRKINELYGTSISAVEVYSHPTLIEFTEHVFKKVKEQGVVFTSGEYKGDKLKPRGMKLPVLPGSEVRPHVVEMADRVVLSSRKEVVRLKNKGMTECNNPEWPEPGHQEMKSPDADKTMFKKVYRALRETLADELHMKPEQIEDDLPFIDMRLDSITGVIWVRKINELYGTSLLAVEVYSYPTLAEFAGHVFKKVKEQGGVFTSREYEGHKLKPRGIKLPVPPGSEVRSHVVEMADQVALSSQKEVMRFKNEGMTECYNLERPKPEHEEMKSWETDKTMYKKVYQGLRETLADELHMNPEKIEDNLPFIDIRLDSITGVTWVRKINELYGTSLLAVEVYSHPTLAEFAGHVLKKIKEQGGVLPEENVRPLIPPPRESVPVAPTIQSPRRGLLKQEDMRKLEKTQGIAVIGMSGQFPQARTVTEFWENLAHGRDGVVEIPSVRWSIDNYYDADPDVPGKTYCKWMGALEDVDKFDPLFFNISPREAEAMDPQQRLFLEACWGCIEDAGYEPSRLSGNKCGVFAGCAFSDYIQFHDPGAMNAQDLMGGAMSMLAARISYLLNLQGPSLAIDTACSSSLVAIVSGCDSLVAGNSDLALAGGVYVMAGPAMHIMTSKAGMLSPDGHCFAFDRRANGFVPGEGVGVILLKRLEDAERDGDRIDGVIRGWGVNQDGKTNGITAPNGDSQTRLEREVYEKYAIHPEEIQLIEAHGTGTKLGDPIEVEALKATFQHYTNKENYCALGSLKSNIGHLLTAAGVAGMIKLLLSLKHKKIPPSIHVENINEHIQLKGSPFYVNTACKEWEVSEAEKRRAAISSFGFSGTNAHMVIEEYGDCNPLSTIRGEFIDNEPVLIVLSAKNEIRLKEMAHNLYQFLSLSSSCSLCNLAYTLQIGREAMEERLGFTVGSMEELLEKLQQFIESRKDAEELYRGQVKQNKEILSLFAADEYMAEGINTWLRERSDSQLLDFWVKGGVVDWSKLYGETKPRRISLPTYPFARQRYWVNSPFFVASVQEKKPQERVRGEISYIPKWEEKIAPIVGKKERPHQTVLIVYAKSATQFEKTIGEYYIQEKSSIKVIEVELGDETKQISENEWCCGVKDVEGFKTCLQSYDVIDGLYFISASQEEAAPLDAEDLAESQEQNEIQLLRLVKLLQKKMQDNGFVDCYILTLDTYQVSGHLTNPCGGGLIGLAYSLAQGDHRFAVRNIDLSLSDVASVTTRKSVLKSILNEASSDRGDVIKFKSGRRYQQTFLALDWDRFQKGAGLKNGGVYVILGGSGTVGGIMTRYLIQDYQARVVWIGRRPKTSPIVREKLASFHAWGEPPLYIQADATDLASMKQAVKQIKKEYSAITGAIFSGLVFNVENSIKQTTESDFRGILDVKTKGSLNFYRVFQEEPLDFICYFSSGQAFSFSGAAALSAYASGITFSDSFVHSIQNRSNYPVGVINWGFWKASLKGNSHSQTIDALGDKEGFAYFERFIRALQEKHLTQVLCLKSSEPVRQIMNIREDEVVTCCGEDSVVRMCPSVKDYEIKQDEAGALLKKHNAEELNSWLARLLFIQLRRMEGFPAHHIPPCETGVIDHYDRWWSESLALLETEGYLRCNAGQVNIGEEIDWEEDEQVWQAWESRQASYLKESDWKAQVSLVDLCLRHLPEILQGTIQATEILFPNSSMERVEGIYTGNALSDSFNKVVAEAVVACVQKRAGSDPEAQMRIIEIGAGVGGTTGMVLSKLKPFQAHIQSYCYTDISKAFLIHAQERYGPDCPYLEYMLWDIERPLAEQGIDIGGYDIVIAANVLHATLRIRETLRNAKAALHQHGLIVLNEISEKSLFAHLTFGLLKGWWLYEDTGLRIPGNPGLYPETWREILEEEGFRSVQFPAEAVHALGQQVIIAASDGMIRQKITDPHNQEKHRKESGEKQSMRAAAEMAEAVDVASVGLESRQEHVADLILSALAHALKISRGEIDSDIPFSDYGIDSILGINFVNQLSDGLGITINAAVLFDYTTVHRLAEYVSRVYKDEIKTEKKVYSPPEKQAQNNRAHSGPSQTLKRIQSQTSLGIAVIGMSGQFPGAGDVNAFWENLLEGKDGVRELPSHYLDQKRCFDGGARIEKISCMCGGILEERACFDPLFFNISPREAESMNPHQRLILQESWKGLEDAGYNPKSLADTRVGLFIGAEPTGYIHESFSGSSEAIIASRLSYYLNLKGPAMVINTGCSSSGVALHLACESLRNSESIMALAGGVFAVMDQEMLAALSAIGMLSPGGRCRTFDETADGTAFSEGVGLVVLKRLEDAIADGDFIHGVIEGSGINQDGASNGIMAPNGVAQEELIAEVYQRYHINPEEISYVEAHGTGTKLGDPVEANALVRAFKKFTDKKQYCAIGSVKAHVGHTSASAGVIGLIKILLSMQHHTIPGLLHFKKLNPLIEFDDSAFYINTKPVEWRSEDGQALMAALNSFGHSGTNVHLVVREYIQNLGDGNGRTGKEPYLIVLSGKDEERLKEITKNLHAYLTMNREPGTLNLPDLAYTLQVGREAMKERVAFLVRNVSDLMEKLNAFIEDKENIEGCCRGTLDSNISKIDLLSSDEDAREMIAQWMAKGKLNKIAELWSQGLTIDWEMLYGEQRLRRVRLPVYPFTKERYWIEKRPEGRNLKSENDKKLDLPAHENSSSIATSENRVETHSTEDFVPAKQDSFEMMTFEEIWEAHALPDPSLVEIKTLICCLSHPDYQYALVEEMKALDPEIKPVFIAQGESWKKESRYRYILFKEDKDGYEKTLKHIREDHGNVDAVLYLWPLEDDCFIQNPSCIVYLLQAMVSAKLSVGRLLLAGPFKNALERCYLESWIGFERSLGLVLPHTQVAVFCQEIDVQSRTTTMKNWMPKLWAELESSAIESVVYQGEKRSVLRIRPTTLQPGGPLIKSGGTYLITGGCGGLGFLFAEHFAKTYSANLILTGRSAIDTKKKTHFNALEKLGGHVIYLQGDSCNFSEMKEVLTAAKKRVGPIDGVLHMAGIQGTETLFEKEIETFQRVLAPKLKGTLVLDAVLEKESLDFICYFSSSSAMLGDFGSCDYAIGNRFQMAYANYRNVLRAQGERSGKAIVINWPLWKNGGMGAGEDEQIQFYLKTSGQRALEAEEGLALFERFLAQENVQHLALLGERSRVYRFLGLTGISSTPAASTVSIASSRGHRPELKGLSLEQCIIWDLKEIVSVLLKISREKLAIEANVADYGFDSINLAEFAGLLTNHYGFEITPALFFGHSTLEQLARYFLTEHQNAMHEFYREEAGVRNAVRPSRTPLRSKWAGPLHAQYSLRREKQDVTESIAIIGMSGRFPQARTIAAMWNILSEGRHAVEEIPADRFDWRAYYGDSTQDVHKTNSKWSGCIPGVAEFDPLFFEISPHEAEGMDPRQRHLLQESWKALEDAGYGSRQIEKHKIGMFVGVEEGDYSLLTQDREITSNHNGILASRLAYFLNFKGPAMAINTACSSSLVAVHQACLSLRNHECDVALAAGVNLIFTPDSYVAMAQLGMLSDDGVCFTFDKRANGMVPGEAVAVVALKRLSRAEADGDQIHAVIRGSGINYDGKTNGITAPNGVAQAQLLKSVYEQTQINPEEIEYIVTHGTGTKLGDPVEINALYDAFKDATKKQGYCALTSTKTNFGHTFAASGLVSVICLVEAFRHEQIPASLHCEEENDYITWEESPFYVNKNRKPWPKRLDRSRIGGVSAFGMSGTNVHMILEDYAPEEMEVTEAVPYFLLAFSAKTEQALWEKIDDMIEAIQQEETQKQGLERISYTLLEGRHHFQHRLVIVIQDVADAVFSLKQSAGQEMRPNLFKGRVPQEFEGQKTIRGYAEELLRKSRSLLGQPEQYKETLYALADFYCQGYDFPWRTLYGDTPLRRISLPTYPFSRETYWVAGERTTSTPEPENKNGGMWEKIHPLLHKNTSNFSEQRFSSTFTGKEFFLKDHTVRGLKILPGVAYLEMARAALEQAESSLEECDEGIQLNNVVWARPIAVNSHAQEVHIGLFEENGRVQYKIYTGKPAEEETDLHGQGVVMFRSSGKIPTLDLKALQNACDQDHLNAEHYYQTFKAMDMEYGPALQGIKEVYVGEGQLLARLSLPVCVADTQDHFVLHPSIMDSALQAALGLTLSSSSAAQTASCIPAPSIYLPFALEEFEIMKRCTANMWVWIRYADRNRTGEQVRNLDFDLCDDQGNMCVRMRGFSSRALEAVGPLHPLVHENHSTLEELRFMSRFNGKEFFLKDHGQMLPGVIYLEMARCAGTLASRQEVVGLKNIVWTKPMQVSGETAVVSVTLALKENQYTYKISADIRKEGEPLLYCQGGLVLEQDKKEEPAKPDFLDIEKIQTRCVSAQSREVCDTLLQSTHGPCLLSVESFHYNAQEALAILKLPDCVNREREEYTLHPSMLNGGILSSVIFSLTQDPESRLPIPFSLDELWINGTLPDVAYAYVRWSLEQQESHAGIKKHDIDLTDLEGRIVVSFKGFMTIPARVQEDEGIVYATSQWQAQALPKTAPSLQSVEPIFVLEEDHAALKAMLRKQWPGAQIELLRSSDEDLTDQIQRNFIQVFESIRASIEKKPKELQPLIILIPEDEKSWRHAAFSGLLKTARLENAKIAGKIIRYDVPEQQWPEWGMMSLRAEIVDQGEDVEIRYDRHGNREVKRYEEIDPFPSTSDWAGLKPGDVVWITGGLGGLGQLFAKHFGAKKGVQVILSGRSALDEDKKAILNELQKEGAGIAYYQNDICKKEEVKSLAQRILKKYGTLTGIIHGAGVIHDAYIYKKTAEEIKEVIDPKIGGILALKEAVQGIELKFTVLFSSIAGAFGSPGQADYAGANSFLDGYAEQCKKWAKQGACFGKIFSLNWPLWREGGMRSDPQRERLMKQRTGMIAMDTSTGIHTLSLALNQDYDQLLVALGHKEKIRSALLNSGSASWGEREERKEKATSGAQGENQYDFLVESVQQELIRMISDQQKIKAETIDLETELTAYGFDSIRFTKLANGLNSLYGLELMPTLFFEHSTLYSLSAYLLEKHRECLLEKYERSQTSGVIKQPSTKITANVEKKASTWHAKPKRFTRSQETFRDMDVTKTEPIAIVGISGRFPGSSNLEEFWTHLEANHDLITEVPEDRWDWRAYYGDPFEENGKTKVKWGGFMADVDRFDPLFFGISPREAERMDPQLRLFLETVWAAIEDAGYGASALSGSKTCVFVGVSTTDYKELLQQTGTEIGNQDAAMMFPFMLANRISYLLNLRGPSEPIDTACSSSLIAIHRAVETIRQGNCEMALVGGVNVIVRPNTTLAASQAGMLSEDGRCKTFDKRADGYGRGEGVGAIFLKPLDKALEARDHIYGLIRGSAENHGGKAASPTAPNPLAQRELLVEAYTNAGVDHRTVSYIEAHGTGTELGDPIEINGLKGAFEKLCKQEGIPMSKEAYCGLGSVKTNIGHLEAAAGISGVLKVLLMLKHQRIPGNVHLKETNPYLELDGTPFYLVRETKDWETMVDEHRNPMPRRAGVSSFGVGGANAHVIIEEYDNQLSVNSNQLSVGNEKSGVGSVEDPPWRKDGYSCTDEVQSSGKVDRSLQSFTSLGSHESYLIVLSAKNKERLKEYAKKLLNFITDNCSLNTDHSTQATDNSFRHGESSTLITDHCSLTPDTSLLSDLAYTLQVGREAMDERLGLIVSSLDELVKKLIAFLEGKDNIEDLYRGQVKRNKETMAVFTADEDMAGIIDLWIRKGKYTKLLVLWVKGLIFDWNRLYSEQKPCRISLPTYPFARERYWIAVNAEIDPPNHNGAIPEDQKGVKKTAFDTGRYAEIIDQLSNNIIDVDKALELSK